MKRISIVCLTGLLFFAACENTNSSTVGSYEKEETSQSSEKNESESHGAQKEEHSQSSTNTDTITTSADTTHPGSSVELKTGANVPVDSAKGSGNARP
ncbi:MAG TPA: hypothetical protein VLJ41_11955 [Segetibacter sp.]|nr:hypothetical protein [Segetibacter sp.]